MNKQLTRSKKLNLFKRGYFYSALAALIVIIAVLELTNTTHFFHKIGPGTQKVVTVGSPVAAPRKVATAKPADKTPSNNTLAQEGHATDTGGTASVNTGSNQWITSDSGYITVKEPVANSQLQSGETISGTAKISEVHYRLKDNTVGVIAQGTLSVVDGKFSGTLRFSPQGTGGRLDIFSTNDKGVEYNEVQINVRF